MIPDDVDEPPGSRLLRPSNLLLYALVMTTVGVVKGERRVTADPLGYVGEFAVLELEVNGETVVERLQLGINVHKCEPPFLSMKEVNLTNEEVSASSFSLTTILPSAHLLASRNLMLCVNTGQGWSKVGYVLFPAWDSDHTLKETSEVIRDFNNDSSVDRHSEFIDKSKGNVRDDNLDDEKEEDGMTGYGMFAAEELMEWMRGNRVRRQEDDSLINGSKTRILGLKLEVTSGKQSYTEAGVITVLEATQVELGIIGVGLDNDTSIKFTTSKQEYGEQCGYDGQSHSKTIPFTIISLTSEYGILSVPDSALKYYSHENVYYVCVRDPSTGLYVHQGDNQTLQMEVYSLLLPVWLSIIILGVLLCLSGLFSGLNLGLMSLDQTELRIVMNTGSEKERGYAKAIMPIRGMGNFLLCSILLGNVLVNNTLTVLLDGLTGGGGIVAVIGATMGIVIFGEIIPQAICSRHGLAVGANTILLTKFFMIVTAPLAFPISKILDKILGAEIGTVYNRERLMELIKVTDKYTDLEKDEVNIVTGALVLKQKTVREVMTRIEDVYMLPVDAILNFDTISEIKEQGYSRIPVYEGERSNVIYILFAKDLLFIDPDDNKPMVEVCKFYKNDVNFVYQDTVLTDMFDEFKSGDKGHMAMVQEANNEGEGDPYYETIGLLTLEDIIEEIIQQEINDETDVVMDNKSKKKIRKGRAIKDADFRMFMESKNKQRVTISPHLSLAVLQFLTTSVKGFSGNVISQRILQKLLYLDVFREVKLKKDKQDGKKDDNEGIIMTKGKPCDYFLLVLEGRVQVTIGKEDHKFIEGPFTTFGEAMLNQAMLMPSSPMVSDPQRGTTLSLSMHSSVNEVVPARSLRKTNTQVQLESGSASRRSGSVDTALPPGSGSRSPPWVPDYTVKAITDVLYLKIRKATYLVALKASRMNNMNSETGGYNERELESALERVTERADDNDEYNRRTPSLRSPDKSWDHAPETPQDMRRESLRSSLNMMKNRFFGNQMNGGRSSNSIDKAPKDDFWDGMTNPALVQHAEDVADSGTGFLNTTADSSTSSTTGPGGLGTSPGGLVLGANNGPLSLPLNRTAQQDLERQSYSDPTAADATELHTTVITVRGSGTEEEGSAETALREPAVPQLSPNDRTSLLEQNNSIS